MPGLPALASALADEFNADVLSDIASDAPGLTLYDIDAYGLLTDAVNNPRRVSLQQCHRPVLDRRLYRIRDRRLVVLDGSGGAGHIPVLGQRPSDGRRAISSIADAGANLIGALTPEPSTWAMMALGFAGLGVLGARKARAAAAAG